MSTSITKAEENAAYMVGVLDAREIKAGISQPIIIGRAILAGSLAIAAAIRTLGKE